MKMWMRCWRAVLVLSTAELMATVMLGIFFDVPTTGDFPRASALSNHLFDWAAVGLIVALVAGVVLCVLPRMPVFVRGVWSWIKDGGQ